MLGIREPHIYGKESYEELKALVGACAERLEVEVRFVQTNHEGGLVDAIQEAYFDGFDGIVFNPAAYTHTSVAIADAVKGVGLPTIEVHISDVSKRESFRQISYIREACVATISGHGFMGYCEALELLVKQRKARV